MNFDLILNEVANALNMTAQAVVELYPQLRLQYIWLELLGTLTLVSFILIVLSLIVMFGVFFWIVELASIDEEEKGVKWLKVAGGVIALAFVLFVVSLMLKPIAAPDVLIIKEFVL